MWPDFPSRCQAYPRRSDRSCEVIKLLPVSSGGSITSHREWTGTAVESKYRPDLSDQPEVKIGSTLSSHVAVTSTRQAAWATANIHKPRRCIKNIYIYIYKLLLHGVINDHNQSHVGFDSMDRVSVKKVKATMLMLTQVSSWCHHENWQQKGYFLSILACLH